MHIIYNRCLNLRLFMVQKILDKLLLRSQCVQTISYTIKKLHNRHFGLQNCIILAVHRNEKQNFLRLLNLKLKFPERRNG